MNGRIISGINNIYTVESENKKYLCRIKGKILKMMKISIIPLLQATMLFLNRIFIQMTREQLQNLLKEKTLLQDGTEKGCCLR